MLAPTPKLGLHQYEATDDFDYAEVVADNAAIDRLAVTTVCTSATRPNTELFVGREIYETDSLKFFKWNGATWQEAPTVLGAWATYACAITGTAAPTVDARFSANGKTVLYRIEITLTAVVTAGITAKLPATPKAHGVGPSYGVVFAKDVSAGVYVTGQAIYNATDSIRLMVTASGATPNLADPTPTVPFTWAVGDTISVHGELELP